MTDNIIIKYFKTPAGEMILGSFDQKLVIADWRYRKMRNETDNRIKSYLNAEYYLGNSDITEKTSLQLNQYFSGERKNFDIPLLLVGSDFQKSVWKALLQIPYGKTDTYLGLSKKLGNQNAVRAVAAANGANAISIIVPCHRIIGSDGSLVGYAGGLQAKKKLLELEKSDILGQLSVF